MARDVKLIHDYADFLKKSGGIEHLREKIAPKHHVGPDAISIASDAEGLASRWGSVPEAIASQAVLLDGWSRENKEAYSSNIENYIGTVRMPLGLVGPLRVNGLFAQGDYYLPLATTEAALVASYHRGSKLLSAAGGCSAAVLSEGVTRAPGFAFSSMSMAGEFVLWAQSQLEEMKRRAEATTRHGKLNAVRFTIEGNYVYMPLEFETGDASGQNMVTIASQAVCEWIVTASPVKPTRWYVEANMSGDKKASHMSFQNVRGRKVNAEAVLPASLVKQLLHITPEAMVDCWRMSVIGGILSSSIGSQGHFANGLAALYIACGQDAACVSESAVGLTRLELTPEGDLYASVSLPNIIVGTVGGGTSLPHQKACLDIMGLAGDGKARAFAEVCGALCLAGELSIMGALAANHFARAHQVLARHRKRAHK